MASITFLLALALVLAFGLFGIVVLHDCLVYRDLRCGSRRRGERRAEK